MKLLIYTTLFLSSLNLFAQLDSKIIPGDAQNFEMSKWDDKTSFLDWKIYGDEGKYKEGNVILISNMKLDIFDGSEQENKKVEVNSPLAEVYATTKSAGGDGEIFATGNSFNLKGRTWLWESTNRKISIFNGLKINFKTKEDSAETIAKSKIGYFFHLKDENIFELERNVKIIDEKSEIDCDNLVIKTDKNSIRKDQSSARSIDAKGNIQILWNKQVLAHSNSLEISPADDFALLVGDAKLRDLHSNTEIFGSKIELSKSTNKSKVYSDESQRAIAFIPQKIEGKEEKVKISADEILMTMRDEEVEVNFVGNVILEAQDITANCEKMTSFAIKKEDAKDFELLKVIGSGNVLIKQGDRSAYAKAFVYTPENTEFVLNDNANMQDEAQGVRLNAHTIILDKDKSKAIALSKQDDAKSFVHVQITEINKGKKDSAISEMNIFSRSLITNKDNDDILFNFEDDVKVKSANIQATCKKMNIYAKGKQKGRSQIAKIEAFDDIIIKQEQYLAMAQLARIFPSAKLSDAGGEEDKSYTELLTSASKPDKRPKIILPPIGNVGLNDKISEGKSFKNTEITSDKQSLVEGEELDRYFFEGNVFVDSTDMQATCEKIEVRMAKEGNVSAKKISQIIATEDVKITQGLKEATAGRCDIFPSEEMLSLSEEPVVLNKEDNSKATGYRMTYRKGVKGISIEGNNKDSSPDGQEAPKRQRPTIILPPIK